MLQAQVLVRKVESSQSMRWPLLKLSSWPENIRQAHEYAMKINGDDDRRESLLELVARELLRREMLEQSVAVVAALKGSRHWWESAALAAHLWRTGGDPTLAELLYKEAVKGVALLGPPQRQRLVSNLAIATSGSPSHDYRRWLEQVIDEDLRPEAEALCLLSQAQRHKARVTSMELGRLLADGHQLKSPISRLYVAEAVLNVIEGMVSLPGGQLERGELGDTLRRAVELAERSTAINTVFLVRATRLLQQHGIEEQAGALFELTQKRLARTAASAEWRPGLLAEMADIADMRERSTLAGELREEVLVSCREIPAPLRGEAVVRAAVLLTGQGAVDQAQKLLLETAVTLLENPNTNVHHEFQCRIRLMMARCAMKPTPKLEETLARLGSPTLSVR